MGAWILLLFNFLFIVSWTTVAISVSVRPNGDRYKLPEVRLTAVYSPGTFYFNGPL